MSNGTFRFLCFAAHQKSLCVYISVFSREKNSVSKAQSAIASWEIHVILFRIYLKRKRAAMPYDGCAMKTKPHDNSLWHVLSTRWVQLHFRNSNQANNEKQTDRKIVLEESRWNLLLFESQENTVGVQILHWNLIGIEASFIFIVGFTVATSQRWPFLREVFISSHPMSPQI